MASKLVLIGNGMAGTKLLEELQESCPGQYEITVFGNEPHASYNRIMLSPLLAGEKTLDEIMLFDREWYQKNGIDLQTGPEKAIVTIDRANKQVICDDDTTCPYDKLVIATGSRSFILPVPGNDLQGVMGFRDISDVNKMISASSENSTAVVIGGGLLGLEAAIGLVERGMSVTVLHRAKTLLNRQLDTEGGQLLQKALEERQLKFRLGANTHIIHGEQGRVKEIELTDGSRLAADLVVMATGIQPNVELAQSAGIQTDKGIVVSDTLQTYDPSIYALGECIQHRGDTFGLVAPLYEQAKVLSNHLSEHGVASYETLPSATKLKVTGLDVFSVGEFRDNDEFESIVYRDKERGIYKRLIVNENVLVGAVLLGDTLDGPFYHELVDQKEDITSFRQTLMFGRDLCDQYRESGLGQAAGVSA